MAKFALTLPPLATLSSQTAALDDEARKVVDGFLNCAATLAASVTGLSGPEGPQPETGHQAAGDRVAPGDVAGLQQLLAHGGTEYDHFRQQQEQQQQQQQQQVEGGATGAKSVRFAVPVLPGHGPGGRGGGGGATLASVTGGS